MGGGDLCLGRADAGLQAAIEGAKGAVAAGDRSRGLEERLAGAVMALTGRGADDLAAGDLVVGTEFEPRTEMLFGGEGAHIGANFADNLLDQVEAEAVHRGQVNPGDAAQVLAHSHRRVFGQVLAVGIALVGRQRLPVIRGRVGPVGADGGVSALDFGIAGSDLGGVKVVEFEGLLEDKEVLLPPGPGERLGDLGFTLFALAMAPGGQLVGVALPGDNGADEAQAGVAGGIGDRLIEADVHVNQGLLHVQHMGRTMLDQLGAMA